MRQVPASDAPPFGIVGNGRAARHIRHYFTLLGLPFVPWSRQEASAAPHETLSACGTVLLLIRDDAIVPFVEAWPVLAHKRLVHCSGSLVTPVAEGAHPLMTFGHAVYTLDEYRRMAFVVDVGGTPFPELLPGLPNPWFAVPQADRPLYHALCVMAGNGSSLLWLKLFDTLERRFNVPAAAAYPYLARVAANLGTDGEAALTGPLTRGDRDTIAANLNALEGDPFQAVYAAFVRAYDERS
jgi:predicted short-subunit dehydrogenase-like oxidoreductase (DUF2520 family)